MDKFRYSPKFFHHCTKIENLFTLQSLHIYPIKSLAGIALDSAVVQSRGLQYDRRWMLVDAQGRFVSQREIRELALLGTAVEPPHLVVFSRKNPALRVLIPLEIPLDDMENAEVQVWNDRCMAGVLPSEINQWFSDVLGQALRLVFMPGTTRRLTDGRYTPNDQAVSFADAFPFLLIGQASLDDLNNRLAQPLPMNRFRPNFVFAGGAPFEEDGWKDFSIGSVTFSCVKPCARCIMTTTDQDTAQRAAEPLKTLATFRQQNHKILFGQNVIWTGVNEGEIIKVGDRIFERKSDFNH